jgi:SAM-dependent methyltransferase
MSSGTGYITDVSYIPGFFANLAPTSLRYVAALNRVSPPPAGGFRFLELGCGLGRSLTTLAAANPHGEFVGVDINPEHTAFASNDIAAGGLSNARVITSGFEGLPGDLGRFDFIALHGVYSWVSPAVREQIHEVIRRHLAPGGLMLVSYNALPGWAHLQPIRGILRQYAALRQGDRLLRIREAVNYLVYIRDKHAKYFDDNPRAAAYVDALLKQVRTVIDRGVLAVEYVFLFTLAAGVLVMFAGIQASLAERRTEHGVQARTGGARGPGRARPAGPTAGGPAAGARDR